MHENEPVMIVDHIEYKLLTASAHKAIESCKKLEKPVHPVPTTAALFIRTALRSWINECNKTNSGLEASDADLVLIPGSSPKTYRLAANKHTEQLNTMVQQSSKGVFGFIDSTIVNYREVLENKRAASKLEELKRKQSEGLGRA